MQVAIDELTDELIDGRWQMQLARAAGIVRKSGGVDKQS